MIGAWALHSSVCAQPGPAEGQPPQQREPAAPYLRDDEIVRKLDELFPQGDVFTPAVEYETRARWLAGTELWVGLKSPRDTSPKVSAFFDLLKQQQMRLHWRARLVDAPPMQIGGPDDGAYTSRGPYWPVTLLRLGILPPGAHAVTIDACAERFKFGRWQPIWSRTVEIPVEAVDSLDAELRPIRSGELDRQVTQELKVFPSYNNAIEFEPGTFESAFRDATMETVGVAIEILRGGAVVARGEAWWRLKWSKDDPALLSTQPSTFRIELAGQDIHDVVDSLAPGEHAQVRIRGDAATAQRDLTSTSYWLGEVTLQLGQEIGMGAGPSHGLYPAPFPDDAPKHDR